MPGQGGPGPGPTSGTHGLGFPGCARPGDKGRLRETPFPLIHRPRYRHNKDTRNTCRHKATHTNPKTPNDMRAHRIIQKYTQIHKGDTKTRISRKRFQPQRLRGTQRPVPPHRMTQTQGYTQRPTKAQKIQRHGRTCRFAPRHICLQGNRHRFRRCSARSPDSRRDTEILFVHRDTGAQARKNLRGGSIDTHRHT